MTRVSRNRGPNRRKTGDRGTGRATMGRWYFKKVFPKTATVAITSNFTIRACSIKCRRETKLIAQFGGKLRDEHFEPN